MAEIRLFPPRTSNSSDVPTPVLHHMCANRARECWSLWNQGYPIAAVMDHIPFENREIAVGGSTPSSAPDDYVIDLGDDFDCRIWSPGESNFSSAYSISATELAIFLIDLLRMQRKGLNGKFDISLRTRKSSFGNDREYLGDQLVLVPNLSDIRKAASVEMTDVLPLAKLAARLHLPSKWASWSRCKSVESILSRIEGIEFRKDWKFKGDGRMFVDIGENPHRIWLESDGICYRLYGDPHGIIHFREGKPSNIGIEIPVKITPYCDREPWLESILGWENKDIAWLQGEETNVTRNITGTLCAELRHAQDSCFSYNLDNYDRRGGIATVRLESRNGDRNAENLWDGAIRDKDMTVAVNRSKDVFEWDEDDLWDMIGTSEKDPFLLTIRSRSGKPPAENGYVKHASIPHRALMQRKGKLIDAGTKTEIVRNLSLPDSWPASRQHDEKWRLSCSGYIQALQGPPGTGKTWTATQIVKDLLVRNPCSRILVCSKEHLALDHLSDRLSAELSDTPYEVVRINRSSGGDEVNQNDEISPEAVSDRLVIELESLSPDGSGGRLRDKMHEHENLATWVEQLSVQTASVICTTTLDRSIEELQSMGECFDFAIVEEAGKAYPSELIGPLSISMNTLLIGDQLQLPPFEIREINESLSGCVSEGYRSYTEKKNRDSRERNLVELSVSYRDLEEFDQDSAVSEISEWLQPFQQIWNSRPGVRDSLRLQWRMFGELSDTIGEIFYDGPFKSKKTDSIQSDELPGIFGRLSDRMLVIDTPHCLKGGSKETISFNSYSNSTEAKFASKILTEMLDSDCDAVAITPYKGQVKEIQKSLPKKYRDRVRTVDGFQGKEADFIILSLVRNNVRTGSSRRWGFFRDPRRINVALSRAREGLAVVTSVQHIVETDWADDEGHLTLFIDAVRKRGKVVDYLEAW